jgi:hypothetical protein
MFLVMHLKEESDQRLASVSAPGNHPLIALVKTARNAVGKYFLIRI